MPYFTLVNIVNFKETPRINHNKISLKPPDSDSTNKTSENSKVEIENYCVDILKLFKQMEVEVAKDAITNLTAQTLFPILWVDSFQKLITLNLPLLGDNANTRFLSSLFIFLEQKRNEFTIRLVHSDGLNIRRSNGSYSFKKLKAHLGKINAFCEKKLFLERCKLEYFQFQPPFISYNTTPFDEKIDIEIRKIALEEEFVKSQEKPNSNEAQPNYRKVKINCQINQLADIFYQMMNEYKVDEKPLIETSNANLAKVISNFFTDSTGMNIEQSTLETYLQKNKPEKRPKEYNRIRLS